MATKYHLATYKSAEGPRAGIVVNDTVYDAAALTRNKADSSVLGILADWSKAKGRLKDAAEKAAKGKTKGTPAKKAKLLAPIPLPRTIYCAGANYVDHLEEMTKKSGNPMPPDPHTLGLKSWHFIKVSSCVTGPGIPVKLPPHSKTVDWEIELAVVIGKTCKDATMENALSFVAGYTIGNDLSARDLGPRPNVAPTSPFKADWVAHKCFDQSNPMGPWLTPAQFIKNPQDLGMKLTINGVTKQNSNSKHMIFNIAEQIVHLSGRLTLHPGDVIMTGTPAGVGAPNEEFLKKGDVVTMSIDQIGEMTNNYV